MAINAPASQFLQNISAIRKLLVQDQGFPDEFSKAEKWDSVKAESRHLAERIIGSYHRNPHLRNERNLRAGVNMMYCADEVLLCETDDDKMNIHRSFRCHGRFCPTCGWRKSIEKADKFGANLPMILPENPKGRWVFATFTVPNMPVTELGDALTRMNQGWQRLIQTKAFKAGNAGWARSVEVTQEKARPMYAHPHFHVLLFQKSQYFQGKYYMKQTAWQDLWMRSVREPNNAIVDVRAIGGPKQKPDEDELGGAIVELLKAMSYSLKGNSKHLTDEFLFHFMKQTRGRRMLASGGLLKNIFSDVEADELDGSEPLAVENHAFRFDGRYKYKRSVALEQGQIDRNQKIQALRP